MEEKIVKILSGLRPEFDFTQKVDFIEEGMLDSFDIISLISELDDAFGIIINGEDVIPENFSSVEAISGLLKRLGAC
jgi:acyl carrier protein